MRLARSIKDLVFTGLASLERELRSNLYGSAPLSEIEHFILLQHPTALGPVVHATPLIPALRKAVPHGHVAAVASGLALDVLRHNPGLDRLIATPSPLRGLVPAVRSLRAQAPFRGRRTAVLTTMGNERTLIGLQALLGVRALRIGFTEAPPIFKVPLRRDVDRSLIDNNLQAVFALGHPFKHFEPQVFFTAQDVSHAQALLHGCGHRPIAAFVTQNSGGQSTGWHTDRFVEVLRYAEKTLGCAIVYPGTARDAPAIGAIQQAAGGIGVSLAGKTTIPQLAAVLAMTDVMVSLDTGTMHLGRAVGVPMAVLGPSWQKPVEWMPLGIANVRILRGEDRETIPENYHLDEIAAGSVKEALEELLRIYPPEPEERDRRVARSLSTVTHTSAS